MNTIIRIFTFCTIALTLASCSKDRNDNETTESEERYFPKLISLQYSSGDKISYDLKYNATGHIQQIEIIRTTDDNITHFMTNIEYNEKVFVTAALTEDISNGVGYEVSYAYDQSNTITDIQFNANGSDISTSINYNPLNYRYTVDGDLANFPMIWNFDSTGQLLQMGISESVLTLELLGTNKGVFHDVTVQPAIHIWYGLLFYLASPELYFFSQNDILSVDTNEFPYIYDNKVRDGDGNLISFKASYAGVLTIDYTITYEKRSI
ncbi:hypothetical protein GGR42_002034 [Saonia flava]|uniref:Uncharacterized protein n=1 Tax=Saonia flava TaxID=523696 RepID=A0A846QY62_9FLAO|nr:hypothetical protein [Saonia flava]NJB71572.1 hypothetical protein [Saonia flava]